MLTISIVTKTFNRLGFLLECIDSVQRLKTEPFTSDLQWEHVIYDDGSDDGTQEYFSTHTYPKTRYIRSDTNQGIPTAANAAIKTCTSDFIFELDQDDIVPQRFLANIYHTTREYPSTDWFIADFYRMNDIRDYFIGEDYYGWNFKDCDEILGAIFSNTHFIQHNVVYKKKLWEKVGAYDEKLTMAEDLDLFIRFLLAGKMPKYLPYISHFHRFHANNISLGVTLERHKRDIRHFYQKYRTQLSERGIECMA